MAQSGFKRLSVYICPEMVDVLIRERKPYEGKAGVMLMDIDASSRPMAKAVVRTRRTAPQKQEELADDCPV